MCAFCFCCRGSTGDMEGPAIELRLYRLSLEQRSFRAMGRRVLIGGLKRSNARESVAIITWVRQPRKSIVLDEDASCSVRVSRLFAGIDYWRQSGFRSIINSFHCLCIGCSSSILILRKSWKPLTEPHVDKSYTSLLPFRNLQAVAPDSKNICQYFGVQI